LRKKSKHRTNFLAKVEAKFYGKPNGRKLKEVSTDEERRRIVAGTRVIRRGPLTREGL